MQFKSNFLNYIKPYLSTVCVLFAMLMLLKIGESIFFLQEKIKISAYFKAFFYYASVFSLYSLILFPLYVVFRLINKKLAIIASSLLFASLFLLELGLSVYSWYQGHFLGVELLLRPFAESSAAMLNTISLPWIILIVVGILAVFVTLSFFLSEKVKTNKIVSVSFAGLIIVFAGLSFLTPKITFAADETAAKLYATAKNSFFFQECYFSQMPDEDLELKFEHGIVNEFLADHPDWIVPDKTYPLEREDNIQNTLGEYFPQSDTAPNIVYIICESLGREINLPQEDDISFTPFLDSLAEHSLYWQNCVSISIQTFGVLPSTTGSLPVGSKGFQFGIMPEHNSIFSILKANQYTTNVFHAEVPFYDSKEDYFLANKVDNYPNFYSEWSNNNNKFNGKNYYGYHDSILFDKVLKELNNPIKSPLFNLIITITTHDDVSPDNPLFYTAYKNAETIYKHIAKSTLVSNERKKQYYDNKNKAVGFVYLDLCLKEFFKEYSKRADFSNTIFVITGDHASRLRNAKCFIQNNHVPLIIYSPMLKRNQTFKAVVSHNDITPSIVALLRDNYNLNTPKLISWVGTSLDTSKNFVSRQRHLGLGYAIGAITLLYDDLFYGWGQVHKIDENFITSKTDDNHDIDVQRKFEIYKYIHEYVYQNNKLTANPIFPKEQLKLINAKQLIEIFDIDFNDTTKTQDFTFFNQEIDSKYKRVKVSIEADVKLYKEFNDNNNNDNIDLMFECTGENNYYDITYEKISRFIGNDIIKSDVWYKLRTSKTIDVSNSDSASIRIFLQLKANKPVHKSIWRNLKITIEGLE